MGEKKLTAGAWGETLVTSYLEEKGFTITGRGYRSRFGEIDIIAETADSLRFVEVKLRRGSAYGLGREAVDRRKQEKLRITAEYYLAEFPTEKQPQFDVAEVAAPQGVHTEAPAITYIENAF